MEIILAKDDKGITVICDGRSSHIFSLVELPNEPIQLGTYLYDALFPKGSLSYKVLNAHPKQILLVAEDPLLDAIPWEYLYGPNGFIVLDLEFVRGLPAKHRRTADNSMDSSLHIIAVPSNPISHELSNIDIEGEWNRLKNSLDGQNVAITLERVRPPTLEQTRRLVANKQHRIVHFMGHGGRNITDAFLCFEDEHGGLKRVTAQEFVRRMEDAAFLVTLNACVSATPGETEFSNIARRLAERGVPYALGMRHSIPDEDAKVFSRTFYDELARGSSVENSLRQARNSLASSNNPWAVGTPVLYTSLHETAKGFKIAQGSSKVLEHQPLLELSALSHAKATFQGRVNELLELGRLLTDEPRAKLITIHGVGGQGKTVLAREASERFAHAWTGGVLAVSVDENYTFDRFTTQLARLLEINFNDIYKKISSSFPNLSIAEYQEHVRKELERQILNVLNHRRALLVLDNVETLIEAVKQKEPSAIDLAEFLREKVMGTRTSLLTTSREHLGWTGERLLELDGLMPVEGARLFWQSAPKRYVDAVGPLAQEISTKVGGHPLSLRLLGGTFDASSMSLEEFVHQVENSLLFADDKYKHEDHRHRTHYACIEVTIRFLDDDHRKLLGGMRLLQAFHKPETIAKIFELLSTHSDEEILNPDQIIDIKQSITERVFSAYYPNLTDTWIEDITGQLDYLFQHGLLTREIKKFIDEDIVLYRVQSVVRLFSAYYLGKETEEKVLQACLSRVFFDLLEDIHANINSKAWASYLFIRCRADLEQCFNWISEKKRGWYANYLGWLIQHIGDRQAGTIWLEQALEIAQDGNPELESDVINNLGVMYSITGHPNQAFELYEQALLIHRKTGNRTREATTLTNLGRVYNTKGFPDKALELYEQALPIHREVGNRMLEARTINNIVWTYRITKRPCNAIELLEQAQSIAQYVGDRVGEVGILNNMAGVYGDNGQPERALRIYQQALDLIRHFGVRDEEFITLNNMALICNDIGRHDQAYKFYEQALSIARAVNNRGGEATVLGNMAGVCRDKGQISKAIELHEQSLALLHGSDNNAMEASFLNNLALELGNTGQMDEAVRLFEKALSKARSINDLALEVTILMNIALTLKTTQPSRTLEIFEQAYSISDTLDDHETKAWAAINIAYLLYFLFKRPVEAIQKLEYGLGILQKIQVDESKLSMSISELKWRLQIVKFGRPIISEGILWVLLRLMKIV